MLVIGITGSVATGKSTVSTILAAAPYSLPIIDADVLARKVVEPGTAGYNAIVSYFGPTTPDLLLPISASGPEETSSIASESKGQPLNRPALGRRVFGSTADKVRDRAKLNSIVHPAVRREAYKALAYYYITGHWAVIWDVPLLFEAGVDVLCGTVLVVAVRDPAIQMARLRARDPHLTAVDAENRVLSQGDVRQKAERAMARKPSVLGGERGVVIWNDGDREELQVQVDEIMTQLRSASPSWWSWLLLACPPLAMGAAAVSIGLNYRDARVWKGKAQKSV